MVCMFTAVLTPKQFKTAGSAVLNGRPCHVHSLGLNKGSEWLSHLKWRTPAILNFFLAVTIYFVSYWIIVCRLWDICLMFHENYLISFHYLSFKLIIYIKEISNSNIIISIYSNYELLRSMQIALILPSQLIQSKLIL